MPVSQGTFFVLPSHLPFPFSTHRPSRPPRPKKHLFLNIKCKVSKRLNKAAAGSNSIIKTNLRRKKMSRITHAQTHTHGKLKMPEMSKENFPHCQAISIKYNTQEEGIYTFPERNSLLENSKNIENSLKLLHFNVLLLYWMAKNFFWPLSFGCDD